MQRSGDLAGAAQEIERAASLQPNGALDHFLLGDDLRRQGDVRGAIQHFDNVLRVQPDHFWAHYFLAVCFLSADVEGARGHQAAKAHLTACVDQRSDFAWSYLLRGIAHNELKEYQAAADDFQKALEHSVGELWRSEDLHYAVLVNRGVLRKRQGLFEQSVEDLRQAIELRPGQYEAHWNLANTFEHFQQPEAAIGQLEQAIDVARSQTGGKELLVRLYQYRMQLHLKGQDWQAAIDDAQRALAVRPHAEAYFVLGRNFQRQQKFEEAVTAYDNALKVPAVNAGAYRRVETYLHRGEALLQLGKYKEATRSLDRSLAEGDRDSGYLFQLRGLARAKLDDYPGAVSDYTQALTLLPDDSKTHAYRGWLYLVQEALRPALHDFEAAIRLDADNGDAYNGRGYIRVRLGEVAGAVQDAEEALRRGPPEPRLMWNSARIYAQSVRILDLKNPLPGAADRALRRQHQDRALQLLGEALALTPAARRSLLAKFRAARRSGRFRTAAAKPGIRSPGE